MTGEPVKSILWACEEHFDAKYDKMYGFFQFWTNFTSLIKNRRNEKIWKQTENLCIYELTMKN